MSKQLYEEAIADVKKLKEIAEDNAKRAVVEAVAPRIRELIEKELLGEAALADESEEKDKENILTDEPAEAEKQPEAVEQLGESEVIVSLDDLGSKLDITENEVTADVAVNLSEIETETHDADSNGLHEVDRKLSYINNIVDNLSNIKVESKNAHGFANKVEKLSALLNATYEFVNENAETLAQKLGYMLKIQNCLKKIEKLQEIKMKKRNARLNEETISLELTGLPDDIDLESLGVNLVSGGEEEEVGEEGGEEEELDLGGEEEAGEEAGEEEAEEADLDLEGDMDVAKESQDLGDDVIVEIDEGMLRREIARMKSLRETAVPATKGEKPGSDEFDDFADATAEGEPLDMNLSEMDEEEAAKEEGYGMGELDVESQARTDAFASPEHKKSLQTQKQGDSPGMNEKELDEAEEEEAEEEEVEEDAKCEAIRDRMSNELKLQENLRKQASAAARLYEAAKSKTSAAKTLSERKNLTQRESTHKSAYTALAKRYNESVDRFNKLSKALAEARKLQSKRSNNVAKPAASSGQEVQLRNKLAETNLLNAKLMFTNKLLQSESLTSRQKSQVIAQLDEAKTLREVKLVYESLAKTLAAPRKTVTEGRVLGSSSQATRSASSQTLNEGFEAERWAKLAGINK